MGVIYKITSPSGKIYVGKTINYKRRVLDYKYGRVTNKKTSIIFDSIKKYGFENHVFEIVENCNDEVLNIKEIYWIDKLQSYVYENKGGMNLTKGGDGTSNKWKHDKNRVKKYSDNWKTESNPAKIGKMFTNEWRKNQSERVKKHAKDKGIKIPKWGIEKMLNLVRKKVLLYDTCGNFVKEFESITETAKYCNCAIESVRRAISKKYFLFNKFYLLYKDSEFINQKIEVFNRSLKSNKKPVLTLNSDYEIIFEHESANETARFWGLKSSVVKKAAKNNWLVPIRSGHVFIYKDLYEGILAAEAA